VTPVVPSADDPWAKRVPALTRVCRSSVRAESVRFTGGGPLVIPPVPVTAPPNEGP